MNIGLSWIRISQSISQSTCVAVTIFSLVTPSDAGVFGQFRWVLHMANVQRFLPFLLNLVVFPDVSNKPFFPTGCCHTSIWQSLWNKREIRGVGVGWIGGQFLKTKQSTNNESIWELTTEWGSSSHYWRLPHVSGKVFAWFMNFIVRDQKEDPIAVGNSLKRKGI